MKDINILHVTRVIGIGGTEKVIRQICEVSREQFRKIILCSADGGGLSAFSNCIDQYYEIEDMQSKNFLTFYKIFSVLNKIIKEESIDIIHVHHRMAAMYIEILNIFHHKILVYNGHCVHDDKKLLTKIALSNFHIIAVGNKVKDNLVNFHKIKSGHITVIHNTVEKFDGALQENLELKHLREKGNILIGNVGRLSEQKGQKYFIEAASKVLKKHENVKFIIVGDGEDRKDLENLATEKGISRDVIFLGFQRNVRSLIFQFDILVLSSLWEGLPLIPIEAFSVGKAIIASNVEGTDELVEHGINGLLYDKYNTEELAKKICDVLINPEKWNEMSKNALQSYEKKYSYKIFCDKYRRYYRIMSNRLSQNF